MAEYDPNGRKNSERGSKSLQLKQYRNASNKSVPLVQVIQNKVKDDDDRFSFDVTIEELDAFKGDCPHNTAKNTDWAV